MKLRKLILIVIIIAIPILFYKGAFLFIDARNAESENKKQVANGDIKPCQQNEKINEKSYNILFLVKEKSGGNTDTIMVINFNPSDSKLSVMSIPRDTYYEIKGLSIAKINAVYSHDGPDGALQAVSNILNTNIKYYVYIKIDMFKQIIDKLGGVDFNVPANLNYDDSSQDLHIHLRKGMQHLDGDKAEQLLRFRKTQNEKYNKELRKYYDGSDLKREEMQKQFINAVIEQKFNIAYLPRITEIIGIVIKDMKTNIPLDDALRIAAKLPGVKTGNINWFQLPGESKRLKYSYYFTDEAKTSEIVNEYFK